MKGNDERIEVEQSENRDQISFRANQMKRKICEKNTKENIRENEKEKELKISLE